MAHARPRAGRIRRHGARCRRAGGCHGRGRVRAGDDAGGAMSEQKHTPGPWTVTPPPQPIGVGEGYDVRGRPNETDHWRGLVTRVMYHAPNSEANARLIAAAPDMLAAASRLSKLADSVLVDNMSDDDARLLREAWAEMDAAIAKATGAP